MLRTIIIQSSMIAMLILLPSYAKDLDLGILEMTPYAYKDEAGRYTGALFETAKLIQESLPSSTIKVTVYPAIRVLQSLKSVDLFCTIAANTPDLTVYDLVADIGLTIGAGIIPAKGIELTEYSQLQSLRIAVPSAVQFDEKFHNDESLRKVDAPEYANAVEMLANDRVDAIAGGIQSIKNAAKVKGYDLNIFGTPLVFFEIDMFVICNDTLPLSVREELEETVVSLRDSGQIDDIVAQYF